MSPTARPTCNTKTSKCSSSMDLTWLMFCSQFVCLFSVYCLFVCLFDCLFASCSFVLTLILSKLIIKLNIFISIERV